MLDLEYKYGEYGVQFPIGSNVINPVYPADFRLTGSNPNQTGHMCGLFSKNRICDNWKEHKDKDIPKDFLGKRTVDGKIPFGQSVVFVNAYRCTDPLCPECCLHWAKLQANRAMRRFDAFSEVFGACYELRHLSISIPKFDYDKEFGFLKNQVIALAQGVGVIGGQAIYHPKRFNRELRVWYFSPHFHILGFVEHGWVDGQFVKTMHGKTEYVVKNLGKRKSVYNTLMYQLSHAGIPSKVRSQAVVWFGDCRSSKIKAIKPNFDVVKKRVCPICQKPLKLAVRVSYAPVGFPYRKYEGHFILDNHENWMIVPERQGRRKNFEDKDFEDLYRSYVDRNG